MTVQTCLQEKVIKIPDRAEAERVYNYPYAAVEETLSNAIYHKSYQIGEPITVMITPEKMEITSLPGPDRTISDHDLTERTLVSRRYRNRRIGDFLKELKLVEGRKTGSFQQFFTSTDVNSYRLSKPIFLSVTGPYFLRSAA